ncbi:MAG: MFS transporter [Tepidamorphaceae bacterium]|nr:MFS transporter [Rhodobiaceae bacterium]MCC0047786.1 MFS transporter [Rhodobiaceae bacterium]
MHAHRLYKHPPQAPVSPIDGPQAWMRLVVSVLIGTVGSVGLWSVVVVIPAVQAEFGTDRADASLPYTLTMIGFALGNLWVGRAVDAFGIVKPLAATAVVLCAGYIFAGASGSIWEFAIWQGLLVGVGTATCFGPLVADLSHWFDRRRGFAVAAGATGNYLAGAIWPPIIQFIMATAGWRAAYVVIGVTCLVMILPLMLLLRRQLPEEHTPHAVTARSSGQAKTDLSPGTIQLMLGLAGIGCCVAMSMPQVHIVAYCADLGFGIANGAQMLSLMLAGGVVSRLICGLVADKIGGIKTLLISSTLQMLALGLYIPFNGLASLYVVSLVFGLSQGGIVPSYALIVREFLPAREAGRRVGFVIMMTVIGMALGGWLSGWIYDLTGSYHAAFINGIAWNLLNITIMVMLWMRTRTPSAPRMAMA